MTITTGPNVGEMIDGALGDQHYVPFMKLLRAFDLFTQGFVISASTTTPPASPSNGDAYIVPARATGAWAGKTNQIARYCSVRADGAAAAWEFWTPKKGWGMWVNDDTTYGSTAGNRVHFDGGNWVVDLSGAPSSGNGINQQTGTTYTLALTDKDGVVEMGNASANVVTIPAHADVAFTVGASLVVTQTGAGQTSIAPASGVTLRNAHATAKIAAQWGSVSLRQRAINEWVIEGYLATS